MPIPPFAPDGRLPPGIHAATWSEITERYGCTGHRRNLLRGLSRALTALKAAGCKRAYLNGSFATTKQKPRDYDSCWEEAGVDPDRLDRTLLDTTRQGREVQKLLYGGELFPATGFLEFFQTDRDGTAKGIIAIDLTGWQP